MCIILWDGAIIGVYTKEKIINTYPPLFKSAPAQRRAWAEFFVGWALRRFLLETVVYPQFTHNWFYGEKSQAAEWMLKFLMKPQGVEKSFEKKMLFIKSSSSFKLSIIPCSLIRFLQSQGQVFRRRNTLRALESARKLLRWEDTGNI